MGHYAQAAKLLESDSADAPQRYGNLLRARRLAKKAAATETAAK
jgi:hypothetical protein